jgi:hypothetical protein
VTASAAVVVPAFRERLAADERLSLRHLETHLSAYDAYLLVGESNALSVPGLQPLRLADRHFRSHRAYSRLLLSAELYRRFERYEFVLVHQLDALALADELDRWCNESHDYVGAPWVRPARDGGLRFAGVGNGGFSLRRVETFLRVIETRRRVLTRTASSRRHAVAVARRLVREPHRARQVVRDRFVHEDKFWSLEAPRLLPGFRIPPAEIAVAFAFEREPRFCFEQNGRRLPFGCHKWRAHDPDFWAPYLLRRGRA